MSNDARRDFFKTVGAGLASAAVLVSPEIAQTATNGLEPPLYPVTRFGARADGNNVDSPAINTAIDAAARAGGGMVIFPAGTYLCYSLHLKSKVTLYFAPGAVLLAADSAIEGEHGYDLAESNQPWESYQDFGHNHWHNSLIWGEGLEDVAIIGSGLIWGRGLSRGSGAGPRAEQAGVGNKSIALKNCRRVLLRDFSILHGGHFGILATGVDNLTIDNLTIDTNRDGMDIDCCRNVHVSNCSVNSPWDDAICLKSSFALGYARATEMVTITNCLVTGSFEEGTLLDASLRRFSAGAKLPRTGRIKFGTESNGGFKNITISNCVFEGSNGLAIESVDGGVIEDVCVSNVTMRELTGPPIFIRLGSRMRGPAGVPIGTIRRITLSDITAMNAPFPRICSIISGIPGHYIEDAKLANFTLLHQGGGTTADRALELPEKEKDYPEPTMFGTTPAQGFFIRHAKGIEMSGIKIESAGDDQRPSFVLVDVEGADFSFLKLPSAAAGRSFSLQQVRDFTLFRGKPVADTELTQVESQEL
ncbi:MAG: glycoside hydrolase family 28 protein [Acidobacteria bacterium]|nr:glycoside hydrolase family 28 protein [Acidobacteriota bacterium]